MPRRNFQQRTSRRTTTSYRKNKFLASLSGGLGHDVAQHRQRLSQVSSVWGAMGHESRGGGWVQPKLSAKA